jgi:hypothetical protein
LFALAGYAVFQMGWLSKVSIFAVKLSWSKFGTKCPTANFSCGNPKLSEETGGV